MYCLTGTGPEFATRRDQIPEVAIHQFKQRRKAASQGGIQFGFMTLEESRQNEISLQHAAPAVPLEAG